MINIKCLFASFVTVIVLALGVAGCNDMIDPTVKVTVDTTEFADAINQLPPVPSPTSPLLPPPAPSQPPPSIVYLCPHTPPPTTVAAVSTASLNLVNEVMDWRNPTSPMRDSRSWEMVGSYKLTAGENALALRSIMLNTDHDLPYMQVNVFNPLTGQSVWARVPGPGTRFEVRSTSLLELGFCLSIGDKLFINVTTDTSALDGQDVRVEIEKISVSVGQDPAADKLTDLPAAVTVRIREHSRLTHLARLPRRVDARSADMEVAEVDLANTSSVHTNSVTEINFSNQTIPAGVNNLRLVIKGNTYPLNERYGMLIANTGAVLAELSPSEQTSYRILADTIAAVTTYIALMANGVTVEVDHGTETVTEYSSGARDSYGWFITFAVDIDQQVTASLLPLAQTTGPFNGREVIRVNLDALADVNMTGAAYTLLSSDGTLVGEYHLNLNGTEYGTVQAPVNELIENPFSSSTPSFLLGNGTSTLFEMPLYLNGGGVGDTVQLILHAIIDDQGRARMLQLMGQSNTIG